MKADKPDRRFFEFVTWGIGHTCLRTATACYMQHRCFKRIYLVFASVMRGYKTSLVSERAVESTAVCSYVWCRFLKHNDCGLRDTSMDPSVHGRELREMVTGFSAPRTTHQVGRVHYQFLSPGLRVYMYGHGFRICPLLSL